MSCLSGGKESFLVDMYWTIIFLFKKDKKVCPRCGYNAFMHGFYPHEDYYCTKCHLWEPDWKAIFDDNYEKSLSDNTNNKRP